MTIVKSADCTGTITVMTKMVTACVIVALVRLIYMREVKKMTDDTISRAAALDALDRLEYTPGEWVTNGLTMCKDAIKALPPAQPEIIRCKDCRHNHNCDIQYHAQAGDMFFCAGAERRTE